MKILYECPDCGSNLLHVYEETCYDLNSGDFYCHSVKAHDHDAKVVCQDCDWDGERRELVKNEI